MSMFGRKEEEKKNIFGSTAKTTGLFGSIKSQDKKETSSGSGLFGNKTSDDKPFGSGIAKPPTQGFGTTSVFGGSQGVSSIAGKKPGSNLFTSSSGSAFGRGDQVMEDAEHRHSPRQRMVAKQAENTIDAALDQAIIKTLSQKRDEQLKRLSDTWIRRQSEVKVRGIEVHMEEEDQVREYELTKQPDYDKELTELNFLALQELRDVLNQHVAKINKGEFGSLTPNNVDVLNELNIVALVIFSLHFVDPVYVPYCSRNIVRAITERIKRVDESYEEKFAHMDYTEKLFEYLKNCEFEKAYDILATAPENSDILEELSKILAPIKNYFISGTRLAYQSYEIRQRFEIMNRSAQDLLRVW